MEKKTKKKFNTDKILELRTRVYNARTMEDLNELWQTHSELYGNNKNEFINDLISRGIEMLKMEDKNISESMRVDTITNRLDKLEILENKNLAYMQNMFNMLYVQNKINYVVLTRLYYMIFKLDCAKHLNRETYDSGALDGLDEEANLIDDFNQEFKDLEENM